MNVALTLDGCRHRRERLVAEIQSLGLSGALLRHPRHVHYFSGFWHLGRPHFATALIVRADGSSTLFVPYEPEGQAIVADEVVLYESSRYATLLDRQQAIIESCVAPRLSALSSVGTDTDDFENVLLRLRRRKDPDEVELLKAGMAGCGAAYARAQELLQPGVTELGVYAEMYAAAVKKVGEPITEFGNDFQCGTLGSLPRQRPVEAGTTAILDVSVVVRGYSSDLCRTFVIGAEPNDAQRDAHACVMEALAYVEATVKPGVSCRQVHEHVFKMLNGYNGWTFTHHLGHGIGMTAHEAPRLNPNWDDVFEVGDVFTAEPGLYGEAIRAGIRVEHNYLVTTDGIERLSEYPTTLFST